MKKIFKNLTKKDLIYIVICILFIVLQVYLDLKLPDYMTDITKLIQVQKMVKTILKVENLPKLDDTTDSMAAAICHAHSAKFAEKL